MVVGGRATIHYWNLIVRKLFPGEPMLKKKNASKMKTLKRRSRRGAVKPLSAAAIKPSLGLCFRCEHRARHLQDKTYQPRCECGMTMCAVWSCYMYQPVKPLVLEKSDKRDPRPCWRPHSLPPGFAPSGSPHVARWLGKSGMGSSFPGTACDERIFFSP